MIISRTPLRISFVGGGSDLPIYYRQFGGAVLSASINKYVYVNVNKKFDTGIRIAYSKNEEVATVGQIAHPLVRNALESLQIPGGLEITTIADIPSSGTGLGSSSSFSVGLLHALGHFQEKRPSPKTLAQEACQLEIHLCGEPIGKQDQYAAAFGGLNFIEFHADDSVVVSPIACNPQTASQLQERLIMLYTGKTRSASALLQEQARQRGSDAQKKQSMHQMVQLAKDLRNELNANRLDAMGEILHEGWILKKSLARGISDPQIDRRYDLAIQAGAQGGKLLGAGAGGFLLFYAPPEHHQAILQALPDLKHVPISFDTFGSQIIFNEKIG